jgi:hypothetical protein
VNFPLIYKNSQRKMAAVPMKKFKNQNVKSKNTEQKSKMLN